MALDSCFRRNDERRGEGVERQYYVYILASKPLGVLYVGMTSDLLRRIWEHKNEMVEGFTQKYHVYSLVWFEGHATAEAAITREKQIKKWKREWKIELIMHMNSQWHDLYIELTQ